MFGRNDFLSVTFGVTEQVLPSFLEVALQSIFLKNFLFASFD